MELIISAQKLQAGLEVQQGESGGLAPSWFERAREK